LPLTHHPLAVTGLSPEQHAAIPQYSLREGLPSCSGLFSADSKDGPLSVFPCSTCRQRKPGKLATTYWAWFLADGARSAWKLRYCLDCAVAHLSLALKSSLSTEETENVSACVSCGADASEDSDPIYCTCYLPGKEPMEIALQLDSACAARLRIPITEHGERLPDRGGVVRGPSPSLSAWDALQAG
jgi:hypothetical protein